ncbi:MAG: hypothetical protein J7L21_03235 [Sulfurimonas sp.]|nr:hypothetical protein [Sulfurimonas sp.]
MLDELRKKDLDLLCSFVGDKMPDLVLNFALIGRGGIWGADTLKMIKFHFPMLDEEEVLCHKKLLKGFASVLSKNDTASLHSDEILSFLDVDFSMDTCSADYVYPVAICENVDKKMDSHIALDSLSDIGFELSERFCFIEDAHLAPLIKHSGAEKYDVFFTPMRKDAVSQVKIVATITHDDEEVVLYTAVIIGRKFHSAAK